MIRINTLSKVFSLSSKKDEQVSLSTSSSSSIGFVKEERGLGDIFEREGQRKGPLIFRKSVSRDYYFILSSKSKEAYS